MKRQTYLDFISELLPEQDFLNFQKFYKEKVKKSIKIIYSRIEKKSILEYLKGNNWNIIEPDLTTNKKPINDVLFIEKEDKQTL
jgi:tRNA A22 N-methylase